MATSDSVYTTALRAEERDGESVSERAILTPLVAERVFNLRAFIYEHLIAHGLPPSLKVIGEHFGWTASQARETVASMKIGRAVLPHPRTGEIRMAGPFAGDRTTFEAHAGTRTSTPRETPSASSGRKSMSIDGSRLVSGGAAP
jgi:hypothetical protein